MKPSAHDPSQGSVRETYQLFLEYSLGREARRPLHLDATGLESTRLPPNELLEFEERGFGVPGDEVLPMSGESFAGHGT